MIFCQVCQFSADTVCARTDGDLGHVDHLGSRGWRSLLCLVSPLMLYISFTVSVSHPLSLSGRSPCPLTYNHTFSGICL